MNDNLIPLPQVAERLHVNDRTLNRYIKSGKIPVVVIARNRRFIREQDLEKFIRERTGVYKE